MYTFPLKYGSTGGVTSAPILGMVYDTKHCLKLEPENSVTLPKLCAMLMLSLLWKPLALNLKRFPCYRMPQSTVNKCVMFHKVPIKLEGKMHSWSWVSLLEGVWIHSLGINNILIPQQDMDRYISFFRSLFECQAQPGSTDNIIGFVFVHVCVYKLKV